MEAAAARAEGRAAEVAAAAAPGSEADPVASSVARSGAVHGMYENPDTGRKERQRSMQGRSWAHPETVRHRPGSQRYVFEDAHESREGHHEDYNELFNLLPRALGSTSNSRS